MLATCSASIQRALNVGIPGPALEQRGLHQGCVGSVPSKKSRIWPCQSRAGASSSSGGTLGHTSITFGSCLGAVPQQPAKNIVKLSSNALLFILGFLSLSCGGLMQPGLYAPGPLDFLCDRVGNVRRVLRPVGARLRMRRSLVRQAQCLPPQQHGEHDGAHHCNARHSHHPRQCAAMAQKIGFIPAPSRRVPRSIRPGAAGPAVPWTRR